MADLPRRLAAEFIGTLLLVCTVIGSGIMAEALTKDVALALLANAIATGCILVVLITLLGPISGAHFNPVVSLVLSLRRDFPAGEGLAYAAAQITGGIAGTAVAHLMFAMPIISVSLRERTGSGQWFAEAVAAFGLIFTILVGLRTARSSLPWLVGLYITAAYWFTASTSFANPAVTIARTLSATFAGIRPADAPAFILAQCAGALAALAFTTWLLREKK
jgi:glycerol uptake facilitator-like aquaporin